MKIGVCFKIVPDYEEVPPADWEAVEQLDVTYVKKIYGCFDEAALETALRLRDSLLETEENVSCTAVTVGGGPEVLLQGLFAAGFDEVVTIPRPEGAIGKELDFLPVETARLLAEYWKEQKPDVIFAGRMTGPGDSGLVPVYLAAALGYDLKEDVTEAGWYESAGRVQVVQRQGDLEARRLVTEPAVLVVGDAAYPNLRMFSLKARMEARKRKAVCWEPEDACREPQDACRAAGSRSDASAAATAAADADMDCRQPLVRFEHEVRKGRCRMVDGDALEKAVWLREVLSREAKR